MTKFRTTSCFPAESDYLQIARIDANIPAGNPAVAVRCEVSEWLGRLSCPALPSASRSQFRKCVTDIEHIKDRPDAMRDS
jgi:hypothetical protein